MVSSRARSSYGNGGGGGTSRVQLFVQEMEEKRKHLALQRQVLEDRQAQRATRASQFGAIHADSLRRAKEKLLLQSEAASRRNSNILQAVYEASQGMRKRTDEPASEKMLSNQRRNFLEVAERMYPSWQEQQMREDARKLHNLEREKFDVEERRQAAVAAFERERALREALGRRRRELENERNRHHQESHLRSLTRARIDSGNREAERNMTAKVMEEGIEAVRKALSLEEEPEAQKHGQQVNVFRPGSPATVQGTPPESPREEMPEPEREPPTEPQIQPVPAPSPPISVPSAVPLVTNAVSSAALQQVTAIGTDLDPRERVSALRGMFRALQHLANTGGADFSLEVSDRYPEGVPDALCRRALREHAEGLNVRLEEEGVAVLRETALALLHLHRSEIFPSSIFDAPSFLLSASGNDGASLDRLKACQARSTATSRDMFEALSSHIVSMVREGHTTPSRAAALYSPALVPQRENSAEQEQCRQKVVTLLRAAANDRRGRPSSPPSKSAAAPPTHHHVTRSSLTMPGPLGVLNRTMSEFEEESENEEQVLGSFRRSSRDDSDEFSAM